MQQVSRTGECWIEVNGKWARVDEWRGLIDLILCDACNAMPQPAQVHAAQNNH